MPDIQQFFASAIPGTEPALCDELRELGFASVRLNRGGIPFRGPWTEGWRACLESRIAHRIQVQLNRFLAPSKEALYAGVQAVDWLPYISYRQTLSVGAVCQSSALRHSGFAALITKDAVVDQIRAATGKRPSVDREDPDARIFLYLVGDKASVYLNLSGESLHRRGYRLKTGEAPLRETLAAAMLRLCGWDRRTPLMDPMCGSGTLAVEAALWAANRAPGLGRERFGFERWANFGEDGARAMREMRGARRAAASGQPCRILASDADEGALEMARANARTAGVRLAFRHRSLFDIQGSDARTFVITNPPYGVRLGAGTEFFRNVASAVSRLHGWRVCLLAGSKEYARAISARPERKIPLPNGDIECDFLIYEIP